MAIDKRILWAKLRELITNKYQQPRKYRILSLCHKILSNNPTKHCFIKGSRHNWRDLPPDKSLFHSAPGCGLPIGNLTSREEQAAFLCSMKSDETTKSAGYAAVFGFNLRQLTRSLITGEVHPKIDKRATTNDANSTYKMAMQGV